MSNEGSKKDETGMAEHTSLQQYHITLGFNQVLHVNILKGEERGEVIAW